MKKCKFIPRLVFMALLASGTPALAQTKIGFVSVDRVLREAPAAQRAQKKLDQEFSKRSQDLAKMAEQLKKSQENLEKNAVTMSESDRQKRDREFSDLNRDFQRKQREFNEDLNQRKNEELSGVLQRADRAVKQIAESEKFDLIVGEPMVWVSSRIDITEKVIKALGDSGAAK